VKGILVSNIKKMTGTAKEGLGPAARKGGTLKKKHSRGGKEHEGPRSIKKNPPVGGFQRSIPWGKPKNASKNQGGNAKKLVHQNRGPKGL